MSFIIDDDGQLQVGPPDDPTRKAHARLVDAIAFQLECDIQMHEAYDDHLQLHNQEIAALAKRLAMLEQLLLGTAATA